MKRNAKKYDNTGRNRSVRSISGARHETNATRMIVLRLFAAVSLLSVLLPVLLYAADVVGTNNNDTLFFQGVVEQLNTNLVNEYTGETIVINGTYNVNTATYNGLGGTDTLLLTNISDALFILNESNLQTLFSIENIVAGNGGDIIDLASTQVVLGDMNINGGAGDDILWGNAGNDHIQGVDGNDRIDGGPGNDIINGGNGDDILDGGAGNDTVTGDAGNDTLIYSQTQNVGFSDTYDGGVGIDTLVLKLTGAQASAEAADIAAAQAFIAANYNDTSSTGPSYTFTSFGLTFSNIEALTVVITSPLDTVGPIASGVTVTPNPVAVGAGSSLSANVSDSTTGGSNIASAQYSINGSSLSPMSLSSSAAVTVQASASLAAFSQSNIYNVCVHGADSAGNIGADACVSLPVYDPSGSFATGGGQVPSAAGADLLNTSAAGLATFAFVSKYLYGRSTPDGNLEFQFKEGNLNFKSTSMDWLVVTGQPRAIFRGTGSINGANVCKFEVDAWDGSFQPGNLDAFGLTIFSCATGGDRYSLSATPIAKGSIIIHQ